MSAAHRFEQDTHHSFTRLELVEFNQVQADPYSELAPEKLDEESANRGQLVFEGFDAIGDQSELFGETSTAEENADYIEQKADELRHEVDRGSARRKSLPGKLGYTTFWNWRKFNR